MELYVLIAEVVIYGKEDYIAIQIPFIKGFVATLAENGREATKKRKG